ncbi:MAG TPA: diguanylate cyclase [Ramlibacter sp.]|nr:diguanylate cyclase [Ramlibacter sp.]
MSRQREPVQHKLSVAPAVGEKTFWESLGLESVTFRTRRLEHRLAWAIAVFTVWAAVVLNPGHPVVWMVAVHAAIVGAWCRMSPAQHQWVMLVRAALLLVGGFLLQVTTETGGPAGPYFIWPIMVVVAYSLLLAERWVIALWLVALTEFAASRIFSNQVPSWQQALAQAGMLAFFAFVAMEFGRSMRELDQEAELSRKDRSSRMYNEAGFFAHGGELFDECRRRKRPFSMVLLNSADLREVAELAGKKAANQLFAQLVQSIGAATPSEGLAARTDAVEFGLALPGVTAVRAAALLHQQLGQPPKVEVRLKGSTITVMLDSIIAEASADVPTLEDMYDRMRVKLVKSAEGVPVPAGEAELTTLQGMLQDDAAIPHHARPTMPMSYGEMTGARGRHR